MERGVTYLILDVPTLIIAVGSGAQRGTGTAAFAGRDAAALCEVFLSLLLADLDLLLLAAAALSGRVLFGGPGLFECRRRQPLPFLSRERQPIGLVQRCLLFAEQPLELAADRREPGEHEADRDDMEEHPAKVTGSRKHQLGR